MSEPIQMPAKLESGTLKLNRGKLRELLKGQRDGLYTVTIERQHATRSAAQNAYYHGVVLKLLSEHTGYTHDEIHEFCKLKFNAKTVTLANDHGEIVDEQRVGLTTTRLNKLTFGEYCESIRIWAASELQVYIPDPDPNWRENDTEAA